jgi:hypothetical protein
VTGLHSTLTSEFSMETHIGLHNKEHARVPWRKDIPAGEGGTLHLQGLKSTYSE